MSIAAIYLFFYQLSSVNNYDNDKNKKDIKW